MMEHSTRRYRARRAPFAVTLSASALALLAVAGIGPGQAAANGLSADLSSAAGSAAFADNQAIMDQIFVQLTGLPEVPAGSVYRVWLVSDDNRRAQIVGEIQHGMLSPEGNITFAWNQPAGETLLLPFSEMRVTLEQGPWHSMPGSNVILQGTIDPGVLPHARRLLARWPDSRYGIASLQGMRRLQDIAQVQVDTLVEATAAGDLAGAKRKAEQLVNLVEGQRGLFYGDHNRDGRAEDPGDGFGYLPYSWGAMAQSQFAWASASSDRLAERAIAIQPAVQFSMEWAGFVRDIGLDVTRTDDLERVRELAGHLKTAVDRLMASTDPHGDPRLQQLLGERTLTPAYAQAQALARITLAPSPGSATNAPTAADARGSA